MVRLRIFGSGRILLEDEKGKVLEDFICADVEKAQEIVMKYMQNLNASYLKEVSKRYKVSLPPSDR